MCTHTCMHIHTQRKLFQPASGSSTSTRIIQAYLYSFSISCETTIKNEHWFISGTVSRLPLVCTHATHIRRCRIRKYYLWQMYRILQWTMKMRSAAICWRTTRPVTYPRMHIRKHLPKRMFLEFSKLQHVSVYKKQYGWKNK